MKPKSPRPRYRCLSVLMADELDAIELGERTACWLAQDSPVAQLLAPLAYSEEVTMVYR